MAAQGGNMKVISDGRVPAPERIINIELTNIELNTIVAAFGISITQQRYDFAEQRKIKTLDNKGISLGRADDLYISLKALSDINN